MAVKKTGGVVAEAKSVSKFGKPGSPIKVKAYQSRDDIKCVELKDGVTGIGARAFNGCVNLESITIPSMMTRIIAALCSFSTRCIWRTVP